VSEVVPFPIHVQPVGDIVEGFDRDLKNAAITILDDAFHAGGHAAVARFTARLFVAIGHTYGEDTLLKSLDEMAQQEIRRYPSDV
jgi:hypothetical protein